MSARSNPARVTADILVVEDSPTQAEMLRHVLEERGYRVALARDGRKALAYLNGYQPALVISDIIMPEMNGYELCQHIKQDERSGNLRVILLTALNEAADVLRALACGADSFITKPYDAAYLLAQVEQMLDNPTTSPNGHISVALEIPLEGKNRLINVNPQRITSLLLSVYEAAIHRNTELLQSQDKLSLLNEHLEDLVEQKTIALSTEISERKRFQDELRALSLQDELTGLFNRRGFMMLAEQHWRLALRTRQEFAILYMDMDDLKQINDRYGHVQGDQALQTVARSMEQTFRTSDILARLGGDEFTALLVNCDQTTARDATARLEKNLHLTKADATGLPPLSLSIGLACSNPEDHPAIEELLQQADTAMYARKRQKHGSRER